MQGDRQQDLDVYPMISRFEGEIRKGTPYILGLDDEIQDYEILHLEMCKVFHTSFFG